jgi:hypothetical protein
VQPAGGLTPGRSGKSLRFAMKEMNDPAVLLSLTALCLVIAAALLIGADRIAGWLLD